MAKVPASVIVLTYNTRDLTLRCLSSFYTEALAHGWQIIVVDNGSSDSTAEAIAEHFPGVQVLRSEKNLGYAAGNNLGLRRAMGEVVILLNSDVLASFSVLQGLTETLKAQPQVGAISAGLLTAEGRPQAFAYGCDPRPGYLLHRGLRALLGLGFMHRWDVSQPIEAEWVSGACLCVRQEVLQQVGLLDERFFLYFEDNDWCLRMRQAGWRVLYDPRWTVTHLGGASGIQRNLISSIYYRSLAAFYDKHYSLPATLTLRVLIKCYVLLKSLHRRRHAPSKEGAPPCA